MIHMTALFKVDMQVRSYEVDLQGIVNNAVYQNYLEFARHEFLKDRDVDFVKMHDEGKDLVIVKAELEYKFPLRSDEKFTVSSKLVKESKIKFTFYQEIYRADEKLIMKAKMTGTCLSSKTGRPIECAEVDKIAEKLEPVQK